MPNKEKQSNLQYAVLQNTIHLVAPGLHLLPQSSRSSCTASDFSPSQLALLPHCRRHAAPDNSDRYCPRQNRTCGISRSAFSVGAAAQRKRIRWLLQRWTEWREWADGPKCKHALSLVGQMPPSSLLHLHPGYH